MHLFSSNCIGVVKTTPPPPFPFFYHLKICIVTYMYKVVPVLARGRVLFQYAYTLACSFGIRPQLDLVGT